MKLQLTEGSRREEGCFAPFVGVWEAKSISDPLVKKGEIPESVYPTARDTFQAISTAK